MKPEKRREYKIPFLFNIRSQKKLCTNFDGIIEILRISLYFKITENR